MILTEADWLGGYDWHIDSLCLLQTDGQTHRHPHTDTQKNKKPYSLCRIGQCSLRLLDGYNNNDICKTPYAKAQETGDRGDMPPKILEKYFVGQLLCKIRAFSGKDHVKFINFVNFSGNNNVKFGNLLFFSYIFFRAKMSCPLKYTELLRL